MELMSDSDSVVRYEALLSVQKFMVTNWYQLIFNFFFDQLLFVKKLTLLLFLLLGNISTKVPQNPLKNKFLSLFHSLLQKSSWFVDIVDSISITMSKAIQNSNKRKNERNTSQPLLI